ncbi:uncharacterized protein [Rutidosis leptorrhynchoides]|uniref:uncharacterized protein n=1 Tax=Rutidosis leptorrhynchoides TaxID=125765 RepID=UPI003A99AA28
MDCRVCAATGDLWLMMGGSESGGGGGRGRMLGGVFSHESEHDLAATVIDVLENGSSCGGDSRCVVTTIQVFSGLAQLADKISETSNWTVGPLSRDSFSMIGSAVGGVSNAFYGLNLVMPVVQRRVKGTMWLHFLIGSISLISTIQGADKFHKLEVVKWTGSWMSWVAGKFLYGS